MLSMQRFTLPVRRYAWQQRLWYSRNTFIQSDARNRLLRVPTTYLHHPNPALETHLHDLPGVGAQLQHRWPAEGHRIIGVFRAG